MSLKQRVQERWGALSQPVRADIEGVSIRSLPVVIGTVFAPPVIAAVETMRGHYVNWLIPVAVMVAGPLLAALFGGISVIIASRTRRGSPWH